MNRTLSQIHYIKYLKNVRRKRRNFFHKLKPLIHDQTASIKRNQPIWNSRCVDSVSIKKRLFSLASALVVSAYSLNFIFCKCVGSGLSNVDSITVNAKIKWRTLRRFCLLTLIFLMLKFHILIHYKILKILSFSSFFSSILNLIVLRLGLFYSVFLLDQYRRFVIILFIFFENDNVHFASVFHCG